MLAPLVHRAELFNGRDVYSWVAASGVPAVASGDVHAAEHLRSWKTLLPCGKDEEEVVEFLRSGRVGLPRSVPAGVEPAAGCGGLALHHFVTGTQPRLARGAAIMHS